MNHFHSLIALSCLATAGQAAESTKCDTSHFLEVTGKAVSKPANHAYNFTEAAFLDLPQVVVTTTTEWAPKSKYAGPELKTVLHSVGADGKLNSIRVFATDNYEVDIPVSDLETYHPILAYSQNGKPLTVETLGPILLVYPRDQYPELMKITGQAKYVWMACRIEVD